MSECDVEKTLAVLSRDPGDVTQPYLLSDKRITELFGSCAKPGTPEHALRSEEVRLLEGDLRMESWGRSAGGQEQPPAPATAAPQPLRP